MHLLTATSVRAKLLVRRQALWHAGTGGLR
jgi:hypothetical protein